MNSNYKLVYSEALNTWIAVAEHVSARGKKSALRLVTAAALMAGGAAGTGVALAAPPLITPPALNQLPTGAQVASGSVSISQTQTATAASMAVQQSSNQAIVNWQSFNVGANAKVNITQPSTTSVLLNRVQSSDPSQIFGQINANGQVLLLNPNGVYFAPGSRVDVGSFTASTHSLSDADFLSGQYRFNRNGATGSILNEGHISAGLGGYIALLAPEVRNQGVVVAQVGGTVALAAGESFELQFNNQKQLTNVLVTPATLQTLVDNGQAVQAPGGLIILSAQAASGLLGGVVKNSGALSATGLVNDGGTIRLSASHKIELTPSSRISADAAPSSVGNGGRIDIITDLGNATGITQVDGSISAKGGEQGGDGGFVDTSAARLAIGETTLVTTGASMGNAGTWLLDPYDVTILDIGTASGTAYGDTYTAGSTSTILASSINSALGAGTNVTISTGTAAPGSSYANYAANTSGSIFVNGNINWSTSASLTLTANYNVNVGTSSTTGSISVAGAGTLNLNPGGSGNFYNASSQEVTGRVLMGMASTPTGGLNTGYWNGSAFTTGAATGFNGQINVAPSGIVKIKNNTYSVVNSESAFTQITTGSSTARYILGSHLTFSGSYAQAVVAPGNSAYFAGDVNGFGHQIGGLSINNSTASSNTGLFGNAYGLISNLGVAGSITTTPANTNSHTGGLIGSNGSNGGTFINNYSAAVIDAKNANSCYVGGLIGYADNANINHVYASGDVTANNGVGGLIGAAYYGSLSYANASGTVSSSSTAQGNSTVGGLVGYVDQTNISYSYATGAVNANSVSGSSVGGLVGKLDGSGYGDLTYSYATGNVTNAGGGNTGGLVGDASNWSTFSNVYATGTVQASTTGGYVGGLIAYYTNVFGGAVSYSYASNAVTGPGFSSVSGTGGVFGRIESGPTSSSPTNGHTFTSLYWDATKNTITAGVGAIVKSSANTTFGTGGNGSGISSISTADLKTASNLTGFTFNSLSSSTSWGYAGSSNGGLPVLCGFASCASLITSILNNTFIGASGGLWSLGTNWDLGYAPNASNSATITAAIINADKSVNYDTASAGDVSAAIQNAGSLSFTGSSNVTLSGLISGAGSLTMAGSGTVTLTGANTYTGGTTISQGTLQVGAGGTSGAIAGDVTNNAILAFNRSDAHTYSGAISGTGSVNKLGTGTTTLLGVNTYSGGTTISAGTLQLGAGGTSGSIQGNVTNNATLGFNRSDDLTIDGVISGTGAVTKSAGNTLTFTGANTYTGGTTISAGTLQLGDGNTSGTIAGDVTNNATLAFNRSDDVTYAGVISGTGALTKSGSGTLTLSGINTYSGSTSVNAGTLAITNAAGLGGTSAGTTVASGATLDLQGVNVGAEDVTLNGGTLATSSGFSSLSGAVTLGAISALNVSGTQLTLSGAVTAPYGLALLGTGGVVLSNTANALSTIATGNFVGSLNLINGAALTIDQVSFGGTTYSGIDSTGTVAIATRSGDLTVSQSVRTSSMSSNTASPALLLSAGSATGAGTATGGEIVLGGSPTLEVGSGGIAAFYSGLATSGEGPTLTNALRVKPSNYVRYNQGSSDLPVSGPGYYALFRESPTVIYLLPVSGQSSVYGTAAPALSYCFSISASTCAYPSASGIPGAAQSFSLAGNALTSSISEPGGVSGNLLLSGPAAVSSGISATTAAGAYGLMLVPSLTLAGHVFYSGNAVNYTVDPKSINLAISKTYDGTNNFSNANSYTFTGMANGDSAPTLTGGSATTVSANVSVYNSLASNTLTISDGNYTVTGGALVATVNRASLSATLTGTSSKVYDGSTTATLATGNFALTGFVNSEGASVSQTSGTLDTANVGTSKTVTAALSSSDFAVNSGTQLSNYNLPTSASGNMGSVTPASLTVSAINASKTYDGIAYSGGNGVSYSGFVNSETASVLGGTLNYTGTSQGARNAGSYVITPAGLTSSNYAVSFADGSLSVAPATLTVTAVTNTKSFDGNTEAQVLPVVSGLKVSDAVVNLREAYADANPGTGKTLSVQSGYQIVDGNNGNNYVVSLVPSQTGEIRSLPVAVLAPSLAVVPTGNSAPPTLTVLASSSAGSSSAGSAGSAGSGSSAGVSVSTISTPSQQVTGLVAVLVPSGTATAGIGLVIALPEQVMTPAASGASVQVTLPNSEPLPAWIRYDAASQTLVTSAVPAGAFPLSVVVTVGGQSTVVQISETQSNP